MIPDDDRSIADLLASLCDETISPEEMQRLDRLICTDAPVRRLYVEYLDLHARLSYQFHQLAEPAFPLSSEQSDAGPTGELLAEGSLSLSSDGLPGAVPFPPIILQNSPGFPAFASPQGSPFGSFAISYSLAAIIVGIGLLIGWACQVPVSQSMARSDPRPSTTPLRSESPIVFVGRVTGMIDCQWADRKTETVEYAYVPLGRRYALASGLMEITYDFGGKVILQGPCVYEVKSETVGHLSLGKLTAKIGERGEGGGEKSGSSQALKSPNLQIAKSPNPDFPRFSVRTPTAVVTDFGTEFGVRVDENGMTESHVFQGKVMLMALGTNGKKGDNIVLTVNESALVESRTGGASPTPHRQKVDSAGFVRSEQFALRIKQIGELPLRAFHLWQAQSERLRRRDDLLAYYDFQRDPDHPHDKSGYEVLRNRASSGSKFDGCVRGAIRMGMAQGRFPGKDALRFAYSGDGVRVNIPDELPQLTLMASILRERSSEELAGILMSDKWDRAGCLHFQFCAGGGVKIGSATADLDFVAQARATGDFARWHIWCWVYDAPARRTVAYVDGRRLAEWSLKNPLSLKIGKATIGNWDAYDYGDPRPLRGRMDELAVFTRALGDAEIKQLCEDNAENATNSKNSEGRLAHLKSEDHRP
jgi:hypothetical protein